MNNISSNIGILLPSYKSSDQRQEYRNIKLKPVSADIFKRTNIEAVPVAFGSGINTEKISCHFKPNENYFKINEIKDNLETIPEEWLKGVKVGETIVKKKLDKPGKEFIPEKADVWMNISVHGKGKNATVFEKYSIIRNEKILGHSSLNELDEYIAHDGHKSIPLKNLFYMGTLKNNFKDEYRHVGTELVGIAIRRSVDQGYKGKLTLMAGSDHIPPVLYYYELGFLPLTSSKEVLLKEQQRLDNILDKKRKGIITTNDLVREMDGLWAVDMYLPQESIQI